MKSFGLQGRGFSQSDNWDAPTVPHDAGFPTTLRINGAWRVLLIDLLEKLTEEASYNGTEGETYEAVNFAEALIADLYTTDFFGDGVDIGAVLPFALDGAPSGYLLCDGSQYDRVDFPALYAVINGNFRLSADVFITPDLFDRVVLGVSLTRNPGDTGGEEEHVLTESEMPSHRHSVSYNSSRSPVGPTRREVVGGTTFNTGYAGGDAPHNNLPPYMALAWFIKAT